VTQFKTGSNRFVWSSGNLRSWPSDASFSALSANRCFLSAVSCRIRPLKTKYFQIGSGQSMLPIAANRWFKSQKRQVMGGEVVVALTEGKLDFGPWEQIFYGEFDGRRKKRALVKIIGSSKQDSRSAG